MTQRIAILGDFSGRAARGLLETGDALAARRAIPLDVDTVEAAIAGFGMELFLAVGEGGVRVPLPDLDALHPDALFDEVELFAELAAIRRRLKSGATARDAAARLAALGAEVPDLRPPPPSRASLVPADRTISDFQSLIGGEFRPAEPTPVEELVARVMAPYVVEAPDPGAEAMLAATDRALTAAMNLVLHHPETQAVEAAWRGLDFLARRIETGEDALLTLYDVSAEEVAVDLARAESIGESGLYRLMTDGRAGEAGFDLVAGLYTFEKTPPHADLLARMGALGRALGAPVLAAVEIDTLGPGAAAADRAWAALRESAEAGWVGLLAPGFMLRRPYGRRTDPAERFAYEEFEPRAGLAALLWGNPVLAAVVLWAENGGPGARLTLGDMPYHVATDRHGDQVQLPCTARAMTEARVAACTGDGVMPLIGVRGRDEVRLGGFAALSGGALPGPGPRPARPAPPQPGGMVSFSQGLTPADLDEMRRARRRDAAGRGPDDIDPDLARLLEEL